MSEQKLNLGKVLIDYEKLTLDQLEKALSLQLKTDKPLRKILIEEKFLSEAEVISVTAFHLDLPFIDPVKCDIDHKLIKMVPEDLVRQYRFFPVYKIWDTLHIVVVEALDIFTIDNLRLASHCEIKQMLAKEELIDECISKFYGRPDTLPGILKSQEAEAISTGVTEDVSSLELIQESQEEPVVEAVSRIINEAISRGASDIHIEPTEENLSVRYRIDGILHNVYSLPKKTQRGIAARIKIISNLDITKAYLPQDGRFPLTFQGKQIDFRVSSLPTIFGEKFVLRILDKTTAMVSLQQLGFSEHSLKLLKEAMASDHGMILVTGPTGSGKSTTLYSILSELNKIERHIVTIEDPVEYRLNGIGQTQVRSEIEFTFASALRGLLRQSPDIVMVGEIRDKETADISIKASLIGQLILSTLHTNDAVSTFTRLIDMGIERYLVISSLILVCAQRLCRKICLHCREEVESVPEYILKELGLYGREDVKFYRGKGCKNCYNTGYKGRVAILEALKVDDLIKGMVIREEPFELIKTTAVADGRLITLREDAISKALQGVITIEEIYRVTAR